MANWIRVARIADCPPDTGLELVAADRIVALYHCDGQFYALDGVCPHQGGPLGKGAVTNCIVTCPWHGWQFDVRTGRHQINSHIRLPTAIPGTCRRRVDLGRLAVEPD